MEQKQPLFSIIVPTYARPERLANCLESFAQLDYPRDHFEVIVVNDGSEIPLETVVAPLQNRLNIIPLTQPHAGPATARNTGAMAAKGKFLVFTDDDCTAAADWLQALEARFATAPTCLIGGQTLNALPDNLYSTASQLLIDYLYSYYNANPEQARFFTSNNFALPADSFHALNGFDTTFPLAAGEDREFCARWLHCGYPTLYAPEVKVYHAHDLTLSKFWRQQFNYGRGAFCFHQRSSQQDMGEKSRQPLSFYRNLLTYPFSQTSQHSLPFLAALFFLSQVAIATGLFWEKRFYQAAKT